ncbi:MerR family DNA-binding transcriptional regulator [Bacillus sp. AFS040349]|uniref:MerR family DNA-binding transcriptional regulator n=1 Tax=Bacillus sp. AFS040349 TaxID=2033502 RepID=UPI000BFCA878|nr:MerR family DNA-binding transcriptional regulator [Bacillus sp. AFS040349]PGT76591.1 MerR family DNA-binding transcriptional regulator [Bacillus sp. AFS040349]
MTMGIVKEMTGLSERQIRYYEEKKLIFPDRSPSGTRKYSFLDIRSLIEISEKIRMGLHTDEIREQLATHRIETKEKKRLKGQLNDYYLHN